MQLSVCLRRTQTCSSFIVPRVINSEWFTYGSQREIEVQGMPARLPSAWKGWIVCLSERAIVLGCLVRAWLGRATLLRAHIERFCLPRPLCGIQLPQWWSRAPLGGWAGGQAGTYCWFCPQVPGLPLAGLVPVLATSVMPLILPGFWPDAALGPITWFSEISEPGRAVWLGPLATSPGMPLFPFHFPQNVDPDAAPWPVGLWIWDKPLAIL